VITQKWLRAGQAVAALIACGSLPTSARAEAHVRDGWYLGFGLGGASVSWEWPSDDRRVDTSGAGSLRAGWALDTDLLLGVEGWAWSKDYDIATSSGDVPVDATLWAATLAATLFPGNVGFFLTGGVGLGQGRVTVTPPASVAFPVSGSSSETGLALLVASGYEARVTSNFALGGAIRVVHVAIEGDAYDNVFGYGLTLDFSWYW
jgi:hypothetical protein